MRCDTTVKDSNNSEVGSFQKLATIRDGEYSCHLQIFENTC